MAHLHIAIPCYGGQMTAHTARGLVNLTRELDRAGHGWYLDLLVNESLVQRARNVQTANALKNRDATHLLFIDADIVFRPEDVLGLLAADKPVVCGAYPKKAINRDGVRDGVRQNLTDPLVAGADFAINTPPPGQADADNGCLPVLDAATGFLLIQRHVLLEMIQRYPDTLYFSDMARDRGEPQWALFDCAIRGGRYLSEDYLFSRRWQDMGGTVWCYLGANLGHVGTHEYRGDLFRVFQPVTEPEPAREWDDIPSLDPSNPQRAWHIYRYQWAAKRVRGTRIANAACGSGYGNMILRAGRPERIVEGFDRSPEAIALGKQHYADSVFSRFVRATDIEEHRLEDTDTLVSLETIEHLRDPWGWIGRLHADVHELVLSVPVIPTMGANPYHLHNFETSDVLGELQRLGWKILETEHQDEWQPKAVLLVHAER